MFNKMRTSDIQNSLNIELLLLQVERSQLKWFSHVSRMPKKRIAKQALIAKTMWNKSILTTEN